MEAKKRVFLIVLDSVGIGAAPDAPEYGDEGSNTVYAASTSEYFHTPNLQKLGFFNIEGARAEGFAPVENPLGAVMRLRELSIHGIGSLRELSAGSQCRFFRKASRRG